MHCLHSNVHCLKILVDPCTQAKANEESCGGIRCDENCVKLHERQAVTIRGTRAILSIPFERHSQLGGETHFVRVDALFCLVVLYIHLKFFLSCAHNLLKQVCPCWAWTMEVTRMKTVLLPLLHPGPTLLSLLLLLCRSQEPRRGTRLAPTRSVLLTLDREKSIGGRKERSRWLCPSSRPIFRPL